MEDIRWKQRFQNFERAYKLLYSALEGKSIGDFSDLEQEGIIQRFEYTYELAWKTMKDFLQEEGVIIDPLTPRTVIKEAFIANLIDDGQVWTDMMLHRNLLSHTYDDQTFNEVLKAVNSKYLPAISKLYEWLNSRTDR